jgi:hypothetical protein
MVGWSQLLPSGSKVRPLTLGNSLALTVKTRFPCASVVAIRTYKLAKNVFTSSNCVMQALRSSHQHVVNGLRHYLVVVLSLMWD